MTKTISLSDEAYSLLRSVKRRDESFSDVIKRLIGNKGRLSEVLFIYPELKDVEEFEAAVEEVKEKIGKELEGIADEMH
jgi:predicted CopG family antitoxin